MDRRNRYAMHFGKGADARIDGQSPSAVPQTLSYEFALAWLSGWNDVDRNWGKWRPEKMGPAHRLPVVNEL